MSRTIKKQPKREKPVTLRPEGFKKTPTKNRAYIDYFEEEDYQQI